jgi:hypothetical protein
MDNNFFKFLSSKKHGKGQPTSPFGSKNLVPSMRGTALLKSGYLLGDPQDASASPLVHDLIVVLDLAESIAEASAMIDLYLDFKKALSILAGRPLLFLADLVGVSLISSSTLIGVCLISFSICLTKSPSSSASLYV